MDLQLNGRRALITGSNSGIGEGVARMLAAEGASVVVHGRNRERAERVAAEIGAAGIAVGDLSTDEGADAVFAEAKEALGGNIEILINNAGGGVGIAREVMKVSIPDWIATYQANTLAAMRMNLRAVPEMVEAKWGRIMHVSSAAAVQPNYLGPDYSGAKAAMNNLTVTLAGALRGTGVTVNTVSPGVILTPNLITDWARKIARKSGWGDDISNEELEQRLANDRLALPAGRVGRVEDIGLIVCMLASPLCGYVTAANYRVDGGQIRSIN